MNTKHTPGPWTILGADYAEGTHVSIVPPNAAQVASVKKFDNWQANAHLIAAAPDLLAAMESIELRLTQARIASGIGQPRLKDADFLRGQCESIAKEARAAIAKATGQE